MIARSGSCAANMQLTAHPTIMGRAHGQPRQPARAIRRQPLCPTPVTSPDLIMSRVSAETLACRQSVRTADPNDDQPPLLNAASNAAPGGSNASRRTNSSASGAPISRSMPASSHSIEMGPV